MPISAITAGFIAVLVGYTSSAAIVFQAALAVGADTRQIASWMTVLGIGMGLSCIGLSLRYRAPIIIAWSTPGAALLVTALVDVPLSDAIGAFFFSAALTTVAGISGWFEKAMARIPLQIAAAMLAGVLARFAMDVFIAMQDQYVLVLPMFLAYLYFKRVSPRYVVIFVFTLGIVLAALFGLFRFDALTLTVSAGIHHADLQRFGVAQRWCALVPGDYGVAERSRRRRIAHLRLCTSAGFTAHHHQRHHDLGDGTIRWFLLQPRGDHCGDLCRTTGACGPG